MKVENKGPVKNKNSKIRQKHDQNYGSEYNKRLIPKRESKLNRAINISELN